MNTLFYYTLYKKKGNNTLIKAIKKMLFVFFLLFYICIMTMTVNQTHFLDHIYFLFLHFFF